MKQIQLTGPGGAESFVIKTFSLSSLEAGKIRINVHYSGLNFADILMRQGLYPDAPSYPFVPGYEVSGIVTEVGREVDGFKVGDRVAAGVAFGGYSSHIDLEPWQIFKIPDEVSLEEGASFPVSFITAHMTLNELARVRSDDRILIDCATGALGVLCQQILLQHRGQITGLTSTESKKSLIQSYGWEALTIDEFYQSHSGRFDIIVNTRGGPSLWRDLKKLAPSGRLICLGVSAAVGKGGLGWWRALKTFLPMSFLFLPGLINKNIGVLGLNALKLFEEKEFLERSLAPHRYALGTLKPRVDKIFIYTNVGEAHAYLEDKKAQGKVLLDWRNCHG